MKAKHHKHKANGVEKAGKMANDSHAHKSQFCSSKSCSGGLSAVANCVATVIKTNFHNVCTSTYCIYILYSGISQFQGWNDVDLCNTTLFLPAWHANKPCYQRFNRTWCPRLTSNTGYSTVPAVGPEITRVEKLSNNEDNQQMVLQQKSWRAISSLVLVKCYPLLSSLGPLPMANCPYC